MKYIVYILKTNNQDWSILIGQEVIRDICTPHWQCGVHMSLEVISLPKRMLASYFVLRGQFLINYLGILEVTKYASINENATTWNSGCHWQCIRFTEISF